MAKLYISEFRRSIADNSVPVLQLPPLAEYTISITGTSTVGPTFQSSTNYIRIKSDANCSVNFGVAPIATTSTLYLSAGETEVYGVPIGAGYKIAVIANT